MKLIKTIFGTVTVFAAATILFGNVFASPPSQSSNPTAAAAHGISRVNGEDVIVTIWVAVNDNQNAQEQAQATLNRVYPDVRPISHDEFTANALYWDVYADQDPGNDKVVVRYNGSGAPVVDHRANWLSSMYVWNDVSTSNFLFEDGGNTDKCPSLVKECKGPQTFDGNNDFGYINIKDPSVLGVTWYGTTTDEFDMAIDNNNFTWYTGSLPVPSGSYDILTVETHEFGHGLGLGHSDVTGAIMEPYYAGARRVLHQDDIDGITSLYPNVNASPTPTPAPTASPSATPIPTPTATPSPGTTAIVTSIDYSTSGGRRNKHLNIALTIQNDLGNTVANASVSISLSNSTTTWSGTASTSSSGVVAFSLKNAPSDTYVTIVTDLAATGLTWDGITPSNSFTK